MTIIKWIIFSILLSKIIGYLISTFINNIDYLITIKISILVIVFLYGYTRRIRSKYINYIPDIDLSCKSLVFAFLISLISFIILSSAIYVGVIATNDGNLKLITNISQQNAMLFYVILLIVIIEELFFRSFLPFFLRKYLNNNLALIISSLIFSLCHYFTYNFLGLLVLFSFGILLGLLTIYTGNLLYAIICHTTYNVILFRSIVFGNIFLINTHEYDGLFIFDSYTSRSNSQLSLSYLIILLGVNSFILHIRSEFKNNDASVYIDR